MDCEYYTYGVLSALKAQGIDVITVAKDSKQLIRAKEKWLAGRRGRVQAFTLSSGAKGGCKTRSIKCWLVLYPKKKYSSQAIRRDLRYGAMMMKEASKRIYGLITTTAPSGNGKKLPALVRKLYRTRWKIKTGYRVADVKHCSWRLDRNGGPQRHPLYGRDGAHIIASGPVAGGEFG